MRALQNSSMLLKLCSTEFMKQVLPKFFNPTRFRGDFLAPLVTLMAVPLVSRFSFLDGFIFGFLAGGMGLESSTRFRRARRDLPGVGVSGFINIFRYNKIFLNGPNFSHLCLKCEFLSEHKCSQVLEEAVRSVVDDELVALVAVDRQLAGLHAHKVSLVLLLYHGITGKLDIKRQ